jgi:lipid A disaccharide synthetase
MNILTIYLIFSILGLTAVLAALPSLIARERERREDLKSKKEETQKP